MEKKKWVDGRTKGRGRKEIVKVRKYGDWIKNGRGQMIQMQGRNEVGREEKEKKKLEEIRQKKKQIRQQFNRFLQCPS